MDENPSKEEGLYNVYDYFFKYKHYLLALWMKSSILAAESEHLHFQQKVIH